MMSVVKQVCSGEDGRDGGDEDCRDSGEEDFGDGGDDESKNGGDDGGEDNSKDGGQDGGKEWGCGRKVVLGVEAKGRYTTIYMKEALMVQYIHSHGHL